MSTTDPAAPEAATTKFSLELDQDQKDLRDWVHRFAGNTVRPAAPEWADPEE